MKSKRSRTRTFIRQVTFIFYLLVETKKLSLQRSPSLLADDQVFVGRDFMFFYDSPESNHIFIHYFACFKIRIEQPLSLFACQVFLSTCTIESYCDVQYNRISFLHPLECSSPGSIYRYIVKYYKQ